MRLTLSLLAAMLCHGVLFGVAAVVLSHPSGNPRAPETVEVEVVAARPDPIADAAPAAARASDSKPTLASPPPRIVRPQRRLATLDEPSAMAGLVGPAGDVVNPSVSAPPPAAPVWLHPMESGGTAATAKPRYRTNPVPEYPIPSRRRREEGIVLLNVAVDESGKPSNISLNHSSGYPLLDRAAVDAVRRWTFEPARAGGVPMFSQVVVPVRFSLSESP
jgi:periplasmic protein TonB